MSDATKHYTTLQNAQPTYFCDYCQTPHERETETPWRPPENRRLQICQECAGRFTAPRTGEKPVKQKHSKELYLSVIELPK